MLMGYKPTEDNEDSVKLLLHHQVAYFDRTLGQEAVLYITRNSIKLYLYSA